MEKDLEILSKYENWFYTAIKADYIRALWETDMNLMISIYEKWTGEKIKVCPTCAKSKLNFVKKLGKLYYKNKEEYEIRKTKENISQTQNETRSEGEDRVYSKRNSRGKKQSSNKK